MRHNEQFSRYEVNRKVRTVMARHDADLTKIDYSFMGSTVYLTGDLARLDRDFTAQEIEAIAREISSLPPVRDLQFDLTNWMVVSAGDSWQVTRNRKPAATLSSANQSGSLSGSTVVIEKSEKLSDVLENLKANSKTDAEDSSGVPTK